MKTTATTTSQAAQVVNSTMLNMINRAQHPTKLEYQRGNRKLPKNIMIINLGPAANCPSRLLGLCKLAKQCYAMKAERLYKNSLPYRTRQAQYWLNNTADDIALDIVNQLKRKFKQAITEVRFNESGDFYGQACVEKMSRIADVLKYYGVKAYTYTARFDLDFSNISKNLTVNGSGFMISNQFNAVKEYSVQAKICAGSCKACNLCKTAKGRVIEVLIH